ncbi:hypothetical protein EU245_08735 [Lentibacillus lipolyticus]|nr:hypothetical protein EU245_08735 [Lentibacillus lipolyticus]
MRNRLRWLPLLALLGSLAACDGNELFSEASPHKDTLLQEKEVQNTAQSTAVFKAETNSLQTIAKETPESIAPMDVPLINQMDEPKLYNGCEVSSLAMLLNYHGYDATKNELAAKVPRVPLTYEDGQKGNPNEGFVGDMENGPGLSVYHGPVHELAQQYAGEKAIDLTGEPVELLYHYISHGLPVWVINTVNFVPGTDFQTWDTPAGNIDITFDVHSAVVTGYDENYVYVNNPYGLKNQKVGRENFEAAWEQLGSQAIVIVE